jgi:predicted O-methyltransferase YrrM
MDLQSVEAAFKDHWRQGWGSVAPDEIMYIDSLIKAHKPQNFIEVGMASGLSGGFIASSLEENDGKLFVTLDHDNTFFGDTSKNNGFLSSRVKIKYPISVECDISG